MSPDLYPHHLDEPDEPSAADMLAPLDAYGHLRWTVGNEDWLACIDFFVYAGSDDDSDLKVSYHVVVDCESAGFIDTPESGVIDWRGLVDDACPLWRYADSCAEQYISDPNFPSPNAAEVLDTIEDFSQAVRQHVWGALLSLTPPPPETTP